MREQNTTLLFVFLLIFSVVHSYAQITPWEMIEKMGRGTNLGNTLEAPQEGNWASPAKEFYFDDYVEAGYTVVRIPVRWEEHMLTTPPYTVDSAWFDRVEEVVDWSLSRGLITIINSHHDKWLYPNFPDSLERFDSLWAQISRRFKDKSENLLFEIINEPYFDLTTIQIDSLNKNIVPIIRKDNPTRIIILTGGGIDPASGYKLTNYKVIYHFNIPDDPYLIGYFHYYVPFNFTHYHAVDNPDYTWGTSNDKDVVDHDFDEVKNFSDSNNIPFLLGEFGADNTADRNSVLEYYGYLAEAAHKRGFAFTVWDVGPGSYKFTYLRTPDAWDQMQLNRLTGQAPLFDCLPIIPDTIEAENFDIGGNTIAYFVEDTTNKAEYYRLDEYVKIDSLSDGMYSAELREAGEWLEYSIAVDTAGRYEIGFIVSSADAGSTIEARFNHHNYTKALPVPQTGDLSVFAVVKDSVDLGVGQQVMRIYSETGHVGVDKIFMCKITDENEGNILSNPGFELGENYWDANNCTITAVDSPVHSGDKALLVSNRAAAWAAPAQFITDALKSKGPGVYKLRAYAFVPADTGIYSKVTVMLDYGGSKHYFGGSVKLDSANWTEVETKVTLEWDGTLTSAKFYVETLSPYVGVYYLDDVSMTLDSAITSVETAGSGTVPVQFEIGNYPNPFNPQTTIHFSIDRTENVKVMIYDIRGRAIRTLVNKTLNGGIYNTVWDGKNDSGNAAASGIYFAMLRSGEKVKIHKMMLVR